MDYAFYLDVKRCSGCQACTVACMDQNDLEVEHERDAWRRVFKMEENNFPEEKVTFISLACMHCQDAPCLIACPTGAISQDGETGMVHIRQELCIGCHSCSMACPFGVPRFGKNGKMEKCEMCAERVKHGLEPACVHICPTKALKFGPVNELTGQVEEKAAERLSRAVQKGVMIK